MTRIAAGQPTIWPDVCEDNAGAIVETLDLLIDALGTMRARVADHDHSELLSVLTRAATARQRWPHTCPVPTGWSRSGSGCPTGPACWPRSRPWPPSWASTSSTSRSPTRSRGTGACWS